MSEISYDQNGHEEEEKNKEDKRKIGYNKRRGGRNGNPFQPDK